jgi:SNF2 family DNA or RNA helicase
VIDAFEKDRVADVFLLSLKAAGVGLTLTSAETVIHYDPWWNPAVQDQATDRAHRIGQKKPVFVHTLFVAGSVEERLLALQDRKRRLARAVLDGASDAAMSLEDVDYLFAPLGG